LKYAIDAVRSPPHPTDQGYIYEISSNFKRKFEAISYGRTPYVKLFTTELEWFAFEDQATTMLAVMLRCEVDKDFNAIVLGRDLNKKFRAIHVVVSKANREELLEELDASIDALLSSHVDGTFSQGDEQDKPFSIFSLRISEDRRNHYLKLLAENPMYFPAMVMIEELGHWFKEPDGFFIKRFQGNEFNSRLFELYLYAVFYELDFDMDREHPHPDFLIRKMGQTIAVEATTIAELESSETPTKLTPELMNELLRHVSDDMPFKFSKTLRDKVKHKPEPTKRHYWELDHTIGHPFVLAM